MTDLHNLINAAPSGFQKHIGYEFLEWRPNFCKMQQHLRPHLNNRNEMPHGGLYATLLDTAMGVAGAYTGDPDNIHKTITLNLSVNFIGQPKGDKLFIEGIKTGGGKKTFFATGKITDSKGILIATGTSVYRYFSSPVNPTSL